MRTSVRSSFGASVGVPSIELKNTRIAIGTQHSSGTTIRRSAVGLFSSRNVIAALKYSEFVAQSRSDAYNRNGQQHTR